MRPDAVGAIFLITLQLLWTGSCVDSSLGGESGELCGLLTKLTRVRDKAMTDQMKILLDSLFKAFSRCEAPPTTPTTPTADTDHDTTPISTAAAPTPPPAGTDQGETPTSTAATPPPAGTDQGKAPTSASAAATPPPADMDQDTTATSTSTGPTAPPADTDQGKAPTSTTAAATPPPADTDQSETPTSNSTAATPPPAAPRIPSADVNSEKQELLGSPNSDTDQGKPPSSTTAAPALAPADMKFLWIVLAGLGALMLATVFVLKSKVLICTRVHTYADVADYVEDKANSKNDDIVLLGVTPGNEGEDDYYYSPRGSARFEDISPGSTY